MSDNLAANSGGRTSLDRAAHETTLFISVDLVDSTKFKKNHPTRWARVFRAFNKTLPRDLATHWSRLFRNARRGEFLRPTASADGDQPDDHSELVKWIDNIEDPGSSEHQLILIPPLAWKMMGDEIVFTKSIRHPAELVLTVLAVRSFLRDQREFRPLSTYFPGDEDIELPPLPVKGTIWMASSYKFDHKHDGGGDPAARNITSMFGPDESAVSKEYLGPDIDEGFRICGYAQKDYLTLTAHVLAWLLHYYSVVDESLEFSIEQGDELKGLSTSVNYPRLYLRSFKPGSGARNSFELYEMLTVGKVKSDKKRLQKFILEFIRDNLDELGTPMIMGLDGKDHTLEIGAAEQRP